jgi:DNA polymerase I-like protein with 3'-5' exonuclease and polymerase domains
MDVTEIYLHIDKLIKKQNISSTNWGSYLQETYQVLNNTDWHFIYDNVIRDYDKGIGVSYRYIKNKGFFLFVIYLDGTAYILSDQSDLTMDQIKDAIHLLCSEKKVYLWNIKHFIKTFLEYSDCNDIVKNVIDSQILSYMVTLKKDGGIKEDSLINSDYQNKIKVFIDKVYKNDSYHYYIPRNILSKAMIYESISSMVCGRLFYEIAKKMNMIDLFNRMTNLNVVLSDIENNNIKINAKTFSELLDEGLTFKAECVNLLSYCKLRKTNAFPIEYKSMHSTTGRLSFANKTGVNLLSYPKDDSRKIIIPEYDKYLSVDIKGMEIFYLISTKTRFLQQEDIKIDENFDIYNYIISKIDQKLQRAKLKNTIIKWLYGATNFSEEEETIKKLIEKHIPEIVPDKSLYIPTYYQTRFGRIIKINRSFTKYQNNIPQSEANDVMINCLIDLWNRMKQNRLKSKIKFIIYDQFIIDMVSEEEENIRQLIHDVFEGIFPYQCEVGNSWKEVS